MKWFSDSGSAQMFVRNVWCWTKLDFKTSFNPFMRWEFSLISPLSQQLIEINIIFTKLVKCVLQLKQIPHIICRNY